MKISVGIVGVTGYAGQELLKILLRHPFASIGYLAARSLSKPSPLGEVLPSFRQAPALTVHRFKPADALKSAELIFLALPHGVAMQVTPTLLKKPGVRVIDLSGDFRFPSKSAFEKAYHMKHTAADGLLKQAVYGLSEWMRDSLPNARLVANPGCYPTATLLALAPLAAEGLLDADVIVDAKSGITGAGRSAKEELLFSELNESLKAYKVDNHQHTPEMEQLLVRLGKKPVKITFAPHLVPLDRGIYSTIYAPLRKKLSTKQLRAIYVKRYGDEPFIRLLPEKSWPDLKSVAGTNLCELGMTMDQKGKRAIVISAIDNLGKGAAGQAVQNMNLVYGFPETAGLIWPGRS
jgi:N-acetyl-gamma-glutamyl-phosphate reductase